MPKLATYPTLYNEVLKLHISKLKKWGYINSEYQKSGTINWSKNGRNTGSITIETKTNNEGLYILLDYKYKNEPRTYKVQLTTVQSNLNNGAIWYFICPITNKRCRILYNVGGYFLHREAFKGCFYETQTQSKKQRDLDKTLKRVFGSETYINEMEKKYFKKTYAGKPTKRYLRIQKHIYSTENTLKSDFKKLLLMK